MLSSTVVLITVVLAVAGIVAGGVAGAIWAMRQPDPKHRDPPT